MSRTDTNLHGDSQDRSDCALLLIDFINDLCFEGGELLLPEAMQAARAALALKQRAKRNGVNVIYVNDNFNRWQSDFRRVVMHCARAGSPGRGLVSLLRPQADDYFVLKPRNSGFFQTPLSLLLGHLGVRKLLVTGLTADNCVLYTASDAFLQDFQLIVPADCVASINEADKTAALRHMRRVLKARITCSRALLFARNSRGRSTLAFRAAIRS